MTGGRFNLSEETFDADYTKVFDGVYMISMPHRPHLKSFMPEINNRGFVFEVEDKGKKHLLMSGLPGDGAIPKAKKVEKDTGLELTVIVTSGDMHHLSMTDWLEAYPKAKFIHSALKFPTTRNGKKILAEPKFKERIELVDDTKIKSLEKYSDKIQFFAFNQFLLYADNDGMTESSKAKNENKSGFFSYMGNVASTPIDMRALMIWAYHVPSKTLIIEHNFDIYMSKAQIQTAHFMLRLMLKSNNFGSLACGPMPRGPTTLEGCKAHCELMSKVASLDVSTIMDYHCDCKCAIRTYKSQKDFQQDFCQVLAKTGEDDITGEAMFKKTVSNTNKSKSEASAAVSTRDAIGLLLLSYGCFVIGRWYLTK